MATCALCNSPGNNPAVPSQRDFVLLRTLSASHPPGSRPRAHTAKPMPAMCQRVQQLLPASQSVLHSPATASKQSHRLWTNHEIRIAPVLGLLQGRKLRRVRRQQRPAKE